MSAQTDQHEFNFRTFPAELVGWSALTNKHEFKGSLTLAMGKCLLFSVKIKVCQSSLSSP